MIANVNGCVSLLELPVSCMLSQEAAKKGKDAMLNEHERHQIELNSMRQSSRKQHQKLKELLRALLAYGSNIVAGEETWSERTATKRQVSIRTSGAAMKHFVGFAAVHGPGSKW